MVLLYMVTYGNIYHQYIPFMLAYMPAPWILWDRKKSMIYHDFAGKKHVIFHGILALGARLMANSWLWLLALAAGWGPKSSWLVNGWTPNMTISYVT